MVRPIPPTRVKLSGQRASRAGQRQLRLEFAMLTVAQLLTYEQARRKVAEKFNVTFRKADEYLIAARRAYSERPIVDLEERRLEMIDALRVFYNECMAKGAYASAGRAIRDMCRAYGIMMPERVTVTTAEAARELGVPFASSDPDAVRARMSELIQKHAEAIEALRVPKAKVQA